MVYLAENETDQVEWLSALEATVTRLVKIIAGVEDEPPVASCGGGGGSSRSAAAMLQQAERDFAATRPSGPARSSSRGGGGGGYSSDDFGGFGGSSRYPGVEAPRMSGTPAHGSDRGGGGGGGVYRDELGVQYGLGSGTTIGGIAGIGGVRHGGGGFGAGHGGGNGAGGGGSGFSGASSYSGYAPSLPATVNVADSSFPPHVGPPPHGLHGAARQAGPPQHGPPEAGQPEPRRQWAPALPDTLDVVSIIDQPPAQTTSYGIGSAAQGASQQQPWGAQAPPQHMPQPHMPPPQPSPAAGQWQMHYTPEGRPYYFNADTGQSSWDPPF